MRWEESVFALLDDLELQAEGLHLEQRVGEVEALSEAGYAEVTLASRVHASYGAEVRLGLVEGSEVRGRLVGAGDGWLLVDAGSGEWVVRLAAVALAEGLSTSSLPEVLWPLAARLSVRSVLRRITGPCVVWTVGGRQLAGSVGRVGADFVELRSPAGDVLVPTVTLAAVQGER